MLDPTSRWFLADFLQKVSEAFEKEDPILDWLVLLK